MKIWMHPSAYCGMLKTFTVDEMDAIKMVKIIETGMEATLRIGGKDVPMRVSTEYSDKVNIDLNCTVEELRELVNSDFKGFPVELPIRTVHPVRCMMAACFKAVCNKQIVSEGIKVPKWLFDKTAEHMYALEGTELKESSTQFSFLGMKVEIHDAPYVSALGKDGNNTREIARFEINKETLKVKEIPVQ